MNIRIPLIVVFVGIWTGQIWGVGGESLDRFKKHIDSVLTTTFALPTNTAAPMPPVPFFSEKVRSRNCGDFTISGLPFDGVFDSRRLWRIGISDNTHVQIALGWLHESSSFEDARTQVMMELATESSMPLELYIRGQELRTDVGDFCIANTGNRDRLRFVRGSKAIVLRRAPRWKGDMLRVAKAIDAAMLEDAKKAKSAESPKPTSQSTSSPPSPAQVQGKRK